MGVMWLFVVMLVVFKVFVGFGIGFVVMGECVCGKWFMCVFIIILFGFLGIFIIIIWCGIFSLVEFGFVN